MEERVKKTFILIIIILLSPTIYANPADTDSSDSFHTAIFIDDEGYEADEEGEEEETRVISEKLRRGLERQRRLQRAHREGYDRNHHFEKCLCAECCLLVVMTAMVVYLSTM